MPNKYPECVTCFCSSCQRREECGPCEKCETLDEKAAPLGECGRYLPAQAEAVTITAYSRAVIPLRYHLWLTPGEREALAKMAPKEIDVWLKKNYGRVLRAELCRITDQERPHAFSIADEKSK